MRSDGERKNNQDDIVAKILSDGRYNMAMSLVNGDIELPREMVRPYLQAAGCSEDMINALAPEIEARSLLAHDRQQAIIDNFTPAEKEAYDSVDATFKAVDNSPHAEILRGQINISASNDQTNIHNVVRSFAEQFNTYPTDTQKQKEFDKMVYQYI